MKKKEVRSFLRHEFGREPSEAEVGGFMKGYEAGNEVMERLAEMTLQEFLTALKGGIN
jgi:hypothetical protein